MTVIFDVDGPLVEDGTEKFFEYAAAQGHPWCYETYVSQGNDWQAATGLGTGEINPIYAEFSTVCLEALHCPVPGAKEAIHAFGDLPRYIATARPPALKDHTSQRLREFFGDFHGYHFGVKERKAEIVLQYGGRHIIDDSIHECKLVKQVCPNVKAILFPMRYRYATPRLPDVVRLRAESQVRKGIDDDGWREVCTAAWKETVEIILNDN